MDLGHRTIKNNIEEDLIISLSKEITSEIDKEIINNFLHINFLPSLQQLLKNNWPEHKFVVTKTQLADKLTIEYTVIIDNKHVVSLEPFHVSQFKSDDALHEIVGIIGDKILEIKGNNG